MRTLNDIFGIGRGAVISAVDLIRGLGIYAGLKPINVEGATGLADTNYEGKAQAAINAIKEGYDFVFVHVEASDEAGHDGECELKKTTIEYLDQRLCRPIWEAVQAMDEPVAIAILPDHPTPCAVRTHTGNPVPVAMYWRGIEPDAVNKFDEFSVAKGSLGTMKDDEFIKYFLTESK